MGETSPLIIFLKGVFHMEQLELFNAIQYSEQIELLTDIEYIEWLTEMDNQNIERQEHDRYWQENETTLS